ncbi:hypothetical protein TNCV_3390061 [Trichonephila clavipes]|nr:hypothetical protein TNCV_3390061 [Trichonephila clavipes]
MKASFPLEAPCSKQSLDTSFGSKLAIDSDERNVQRMMMREHFGQQLHNTLFSVGVDVNNLGGLQTFDNDSKLRHKRNEIREMHSLVFD